jgi:8-hydroxy-5-deazaflavin:NADPH oxidoreductase
MKIAILGPGNIGTALAIQWSKKGHDIIFSHSNKIEKINQLLSLIKDSGFKKLPDAISDAEIIIITCQYDGLKEIFANSALFTNKIVLSCVSNLRPDFSGNTIGLHTERTTSVAEEIQENLPNALVGEAFNSAFAANINNPNKIDDSKDSSIFYCTNHDSIRSTIEQLIMDINYEPVNAGNLKSARALETFATIWVQMAVVANKYPGYELKIIKR